MKLRVIELFSGVGAQRMALERLAERHSDLELEFVAQCDIDKFAVQSYNAIHGETPNLGDISKVEHLPNADVVTWSFPCTDLSQAGQKKGMGEGTGTRSALCWEVVRLLKDARERESCPEWLVMENVPAILFKGNKPEFDRLCESLEEIGYQNRYQIINATDFDVAQNRKRCFMVSHYNGTVPKFPEPIGLKHVLKDYLEEDVPQKYFLSKERLKGLIMSTEKERERGNGFAFEIRDEDRQPSKSITTAEGHRKVSTYVKD